LMEIHGVTYNDEKAAGEMLVQACTQMKKAHADAENIGSFWGFQMKISYSLFDNSFYVRLTREASFIVEVKKDPVRNIERILTAMRNLPGQKKTAEERLEDARQQLVQAKEEVQKPFEKEEELKNVQAELEKAKQDAQDQYEAMKIRIKYMYENGGSSMLELLLSSNNLSDFLNEASNIASISTYDRNMLKKYEETQEAIKTQEAQVAEESTSISNLLTEKSSKQQEVQNLVSTTNDNISSYVNQISASQEEASALMAQVNSADSSISQLMEQAEQERAAEEAAAEAAVAAEAARDTEDTGAADEGDSSEEATTDAEEISTDDSSSESSDAAEDTSGAEDSSTSDDTSADTSSAEDTSSDSSDSSSSDSGSSSQGTYLGNFMLTGYCNCAQCCGTAGNATASGVMPTAGHTVAMAGVPFGTQLLINGTVYTVEDLGTPYGHVDIYCGSHSEALSFGLQYADVYQLN
jgi:peptidoglycan hydrolase CwlO-like protein/3D (Asp-Asp-Asp) domain-containing protein